MNNCIQKINHSQIKCEEKQSKFILLNPEFKYVEYITVDGCIYPRGTKGLRCDFALSFDHKTIFVELKGSDVAYAIRQILATNKDAKFKINQDKIALIVTSKMPKDDSSLKREKMNLKKQQINLIYGNSPLIKNFADL